MPDESVMGLLLRAHAECAAQAHGEIHIHHNISAGNHWDQAQAHVESAIRSVNFANEYVAREHARKSVKEAPHA